MKMSNFSSICLTPDCSGRGTCMVPEGSIGNISMCICDFPWSGQTDVLNFDGYDCVDLGILRQIFFGLTTVPHFINQLAIISAFKCQWHTYLSIKGKKRKNGPTIRHWWQMLSFKVLIAMQVALIGILFIW
jgi:hypothetical protein